FWPPVEKWGDGARRTLYLAVLEEMDRQLGVLFDRVQNDPELRNNTLILACSDKGPDPGAGDAGPFRGLKTNLYEGGIRSSLVAWGPGVLSAQKKVDKDSLFSAIDLVPTLLHLTGTEASPDTTFDGETIPGIFAESGQSRKAPLFFRRPPDRNTFHTGEDLPDLAMRTAEWKLLCEFDGSGVQLYNISEDLGENHNLAEKRPEVVKELLPQLLSWQESMPQDNGATYKDPRRNKKKK
ncbi:MAG: sulfatase-like hydrolase/transferase, partial [Verrucomicrobiota bacterium]